MKILADIWGRIFRRRRGSPPQTPALPTRTEVQIYYSGLLEVAKDPTVRRDTIYFLNDGHPISTNQWFRQFVCYYLSRYDLELGDLTDIMKNEALTGEPAAEQIWAAYQADKLRGLVK